MAFAADIRTETLTPLAPADPGHWIALETERFVAAIAEATTGTQTASIGRDWLAHGSIRPLIVGPHPLGRLDEHWTLRLDAPDPKASSLLPHRSELDVRATTQGRTETLAPAPTVDIALDGDTLWACHRASAVRITHPRIGEALAHLGTTRGRTDPGLLTLIARLGEIGVAVAQSPITPCHAEAWSRFGATPARALQTIAEMKIAVVDLRTAPRIDDAYLREGFSRLGIQTQAQPCDANLTWILVDSAAATLNALRRAEHALLGADTAWAVCTITPDAITVETGRGARSQGPMAAARAQACEPADVALDPEHLVASAISAVVHTPRTGTHVRLQASKHAIISRPPARALRLIEGTHLWCGRTARLARALETNAAQGEASNNTSVHVLLTERLDDTTALESVIEEGAPWAIVHPHWTGWVIIGHGGRHGGPCPRCVALRSAGAWGSDQTDRQDPNSDPSGRSVPATAIARAIAAHTTRSTPHATLTWTDPNGHRLGPDEHIAAQQRCPHGRHHDVAEKRHVDQRNAQKGRWCGSITTSHAGKAKMFAHWAHIHHAQRHPQRTRATGLAAGAADPSPDGARKRAMAEAAERDACQWHEGQRRSQPYSVNTLNQLGIRHLTPAMLAPFTEAQHEQRDTINARKHRHLRIPAAFGPAEHDTPLRWCTGTDWTTPTREEVWVPEEWTFLGAPPALGDGARRGPNRRFCVADTNGCASSTASLDQAIAYAFTELVERDARALWWYAQAIRPRIDLNALGDPWLAEAPERYRTIRRTLTVLDATTTPAIKVLIAVSRRETPLQDGSWDPVITSGAGATTTAAAGAAVREHVQCGPRSGADPHQSWYEHAAAPERQALRRLGPDDAPWLEGQGIASRCEPMDQAPAAAHPISACPTAVDVTPSPREAQTPSIERALRAARGLEASLIAIDLTLSPLDPFVARVAAPELCHPWHRLGHPRLSTGPRTAGWTDRTLDANEINPIPLVM